MEKKTDVREIYAIQRFFLFSLVLTFLKIIVTVISSDYQSLRIIAIDAILDLIVSGIGLYLIQLQTNVFQKVKSGSQKIEVSKSGTLGIAAIQGVIFLIGGVVVLIQSVVEYQERNSAIFEGVAPSKYNIMAGFIISAIICAKFGMLVIHKKDSEELENLALKSIQSNLEIDLLVNLLAWVILLTSPVNTWMWFVFDPVFASLIGIWMILSGLRYIGPSLKAIEWDSATNNDMSGGNEGNIEKEEKKTVETKE